MTHDHVGSLASRRRFSNMLESIITTCSHFEDPQQVSKDLKSSFSKASVIYENLQTENFSPGYSDRLAPINNKLVDSYLANKKSSPQKLEFNKILSSSPTNVKALENSPSLLTFESVGEEDISQILINNKRGFGKIWETEESPEKPFLTPSYLSADPSPRYFSNPKPTHSKPLSRKIQFKQGTFIKKDISITLNEPDTKLPPLSLSPIHKKNTSMPQVNMDLYTKTHSPYIPPSKDQKQGEKLRKYINDLMIKNLGIRYKAPGEDSRFKKREKESETKPNYTDEQDLLSLGYINYNNDLATKVQVQRMMVNQHRYERKMTLINFPPLKKQKKKT